MDFEGALSVETLAVGDQWYITDEAGHVWQVLRNGVDLELARVNLIDAEVGNEAIQAVENSAVLIDAYLKSSSGEQTRGKSKGLKFGASGSSSGGVLATNRVASETLAWIAGGSVKAGGSVQILAEDTANIRSKSSLWLCQ